MQLEDMNLCFACGRDNPRGLHLEFHFEGEEYVAEFTPQDWHQGWAGIVHGGLVATLLDEVMTRMCWERGLNVATAQLNVRYRQSVPIGRKTITRGRIQQRRGPFVEAAAETYLEDGSVAATASGKFMAPQ